MKKITLIIAVVVILFIGAGIYLFASRTSNTAQTATNGDITASTTQSGSTELLAGTSEATTSINDLHATRVFTIKATSFSFTPSTISVNMGDVVELHIVSDGNHSFRIDKLHISQATPPGETVIKFSADQTGTFDFYCGVPGHREQGMTGQLIVK